LDYLNEYLLKVIPINILELLAAIAGAYYLRKTHDAPIVNKYFVYFLWYTFINEVIGAYGVVAYFTNYEYFGFIKDTIFERTYWLYNIWYLLFNSFFIYYFRELLLNYSFKRILRIALILYVIFGVVNLIYDNLLFKGDSLYNGLVGSIFLLMAIILFYFDLLKSDRVLNIKKYLPIYVSLGVLVFSLCTTPLDIFAQYFNTENNIYIKLRASVLLFVNIFMYGAFIIGFLVCVKNKPKTEKSIN